MCKNALTLNYDALVKRHPALSEENKIGILRVLQSASTQMQLLLTMNLVLPELFELGNQSQSYIIPPAVIAENLFFVSKSTCNHPPYGYKFNYDFDISKNTITNPGYTGPEIEPLLKENLAGWIAYRSICKMSRPQFDDPLLEHPYHLEKKADRPYLESLICMTCNLTWRIHELWEEIFNDRDRIRSILFLISPYHLMTIDNHQY